MLASDADGDGHPALSFSLASDIVELVVFTTDDAFLQTMRDAVGDSRRLWHVPSADKVSDLLLAGEVGIVVLDVHALPEAASVFVAQIKRQFPDLVVIAAGNREAETSLASLVMAGVIYRFIHKPMSPARAKLFTDAAVKKHDEQRKRLPVPPEIAWIPAANRRLMIGAATGTLVVGIIAIWALQQGHRVPTDHDGLDPYTQELARKPGGDTAQAGLAGAHEHLLARAENALLEERLDEAATAIDAARKAGVDGGRVAFLTAQLAKSRERLKEAIARAHLRSDAQTAAASAEERTNGFLDRAAERMQEGHLIEPEGDSARFYVGEALRSDPEGNATKAAQQTLAHALLADARGAIDRPDFARAASLLEAAVGIAADPDLESAGQLLSAARKQADADTAHAGLDEAATVGLSSADSSAALREVEAASNQSGAANPPEAANRPVTANAQPAVANVVGADRLTLVKSVKPIYPTGAERAKTEGWVELDFTVAEGGEVEGISVRAASPAGVFDNAAIAALSQWRYKPVMDEGKPIAQHSRIRIRFTLTG